MAGGQGSACRSGAVSLRVRLRMGTLRYSDARRPGRKRKNTVAPAPEPTGFTHLYLVAWHFYLVAWHCTTPTACPRGSGGRPGPRAGAQPLFSRQLQRSIPFFTGCGGIGSQGWAPAFAGATNGGQRPAQQGWQAYRIQAGTRCVHAVGPRAGASRRLAGCRRVCLRFRRPRLGGRGDAAGAPPLFSSGL